MKSITSIINHNVAYVLCIAYINQYTDVYLDAFARLCT